MSFPDAAWEVWCAHVERSLSSAGVVPRPARRQLGHPVALTPAQSSKRVRRPLQERKLRRRLRRAQEAASREAAGQQVPRSLAKKTLAADRELPRWARSAALPGRGALRPGLRRPPAIWPRSARTASRHGSTVAAPSPALVLGSGARRDHPRPSQRRR
eukprot:12661734-Alexandrium_andersonii.AAC.1